MDDPCARIKFVLVEFLLLVFSVLKVLIGIVIINIINTIASVSGIYKRIRTVRLTTLALFTTITPHKYRIQTPSDILAHFLD